MKQAVVGSNVGFHVGWCGSPDKDWASGLNSLERVCRECRVFLAEEAAGDFKVRRFEGVLASGERPAVRQPLHILGLE